MSAAESSKNIYCIGVDLFDTFMAFNNNFTNMESNYDT